MVHASWIREEEREIQFVTRFEKPRSPQGWAFRYVVVTMNAAFILGAGLGTRLRPLTDLHPKPLVPVGDRPLVLSILDNLAPFAPRVVNAYHLADQVVRALQGKAEVVVESTLLGTAGGLRNAAPLLGEGDVLVHNGDVVVSARDFTLRNPRSVHPEADAVLLVRKARGEGNVGVAEDGRIVRLRRTSWGRELLQAEFLGVQWISRSLRKRLPAVGCLIGDVAIPEGLRGTPLYAHLSEGPFFDIGDLASYAAANFAWLEGNDAWTAPTALVHPGCQLRRTLVGDRARVHEGVSLAECIVWPDTVVRTSHTRAILTPDCVLPIP